MNFSSIILTLTDNCNFSCSYCYKPKSNAFLNFAKAREALLFFLPYLVDTSYITFYGGEPLLCFDQIRKIVHFLDNRKLKFKKEFHYSISTNGSLMSEEVINFFDEHRFRVGLSFDVLSQDITRKADSFGAMVSLIQRLQKYENISLETNSVFIPDTVKTLSDSMKFLWEIGVQRIRYSFSYIEQWEKEAISDFEREMEKLKKFMGKIYNETQKIPIINFLEKQDPKIRYCPAGLDRISITPNGEIWGCPLFYDYFKRLGDPVERKEFLFGSIGESKAKFDNIYPRISENYAALTMENFSTPEMHCFLCPNIAKCVVCPIASSFSGSSLKTIPHFICEIQKIKIREESDYFDNIGS